MDEVTGSSPVRSTIMNPEKAETPESTPELDRLLKERRALSWRMFRMMFENIIIFGAPAVAAVFIGRYYGVLFLSLGIAFVFSWIIFFISYREVLRKVNSVEDQIKAERKRAGIPEPVSPGYPPEDGAEEEASEEIIRRGKNDQEK